jgi:uncharacterized protein (TIGR02588 family)
MSPRRKINRFEQMVLAVSVLAIVAVMGGLTYYGITSGTGPAELETTIMDTGRRVNGEKVYSVVIQNKGGKTAEDLIIEVSAGETTLEVDIRLVTKGDKEEVFVMLPEGIEPEAKIISYSEH